jgi:hypothetical protein
MRFKGFIGPAYTLDSVNVECQRCVNLYPEINEAGTGKEGEVIRFVSTPGLTNIIEVGAGPIRCVHVDPRGTVLVASGDKMYKITYSGAVWSSSLLGSLSSSNGTITARSNYNSTSGDTVTVFCDGTANYAYRYLSSVESFGTFTSLSYSGVDTATHVALIDGYFIFNKPGTNLFYVSDWNTLTVSPLSFASAEGDPDNGVTLIENHRDLWIINERSAEVFTNTGNPDFPFERVQGGFIEKGCVAPYSIAKVDGVIFWLGRDKTGHGIVYAAQGLQPQRISTHAIEKAIGGYDIDSITTADAFTYSDGGHSFYVLNFPEATWVYDLTTKMWHERAYNNSGTLERHRANYHAFIPQYGIHLLGDYDDNRIYQFDNEVYKDDTTPIIRKRSSPHVSGGMKRIFCKSFQLDIETGVGLDGGVQGSSPQAMLRFSDDGGHTWSNEKWASIGAIGKYKTRAIWRRLGNFRDRVFEVTISDPVKVSILGAEVEVEGGLS